MLNKYKISIIQLIKLYSVGFKKGCSISYLSGVCWFFLSVKSASLPRGQTQPQSETADLQKQ